MKNESGLQPRGRAVLIKMLGEVASRKAGVIHIPEIVREKTDMMEQKALVIAIGPSCWNDEPGPRAEVGEVVLVTKFAGYMTRGPRDGRRYRLVNDRDIFSALDTDLADELIQESLRQEEKEIQAKEMAHG